MERRSTKFPSRRTSRAPTEGSLAASPAPSPGLDFRGFPDFESNVVYCPVQAFTVLIPSASRGCVRIVLHMIRKTLGWLDERGEPIEERFQFTYDELQDGAGVGRDAIAEALAEAVAGRFIRVVREPRKKALGQSGQSGVYELNWDSERYTDSPAEFQGFYEKGSYVGEDGEARFSRKNIPNAFFDVLVRREKLSVIRVVGALLFYSIQWGRGGERKTPVRKSKRELARLARIDPSNAARAIVEAVEANYIERVECGVFDLSSRQESKATLFGIKWTRSCTYTPAGELVMIPGGREQSENAPRPETGTVGKRTPALEAEQSENAPRISGISRFSHPGEQSENAPRNSRKTHPEEQSENARHKEVKVQRIKTSTKTTPCAPVGAVVVDVENPNIGYELLKNAGIGESEARRLAQRHNAGEIRNQIEWLPLRNPRRNPAGLLRTALERGLPPPAAALKLPTSVTFEEPPETALARSFAAFFYAGFHGNKGRPVAPPSAADLDAAAEFVPRLAEIAGGAGEERIEQWGRDFGRRVAENLRGKEAKIVSFVAALRSYGDQYFGGFESRIREERERERYRLLAKAQEAHEARFSPQHRRYLKKAFARFSKRRPGEMARFEAERKRSLTGGGFHQPSPEMLARLDTEAARLDAFQRHFADFDGDPVLDFWDWDAKLNPEAFSEENPNP